MLKKTFDQQEILILYICAGSKVSELEKKLD